MSLCAFLAGTLLLSNPSATLAQEPSPIGIEAEVGFDGKARVGHWMPVVVELENQGPDFEGELQVSGPSGEFRQSGPTYQSRYVADVLLPRGSRKRIALYVPYLSAVPRLEVDLVSRGKVVTSLEPRVTVVGENDLFIGVIGQRVGAWNLLTTLELPGQGRQVEVTPLATDGFPERLEVLDAFDVIALGDVTTEALSPGALEALEGWIAGGGTLVVSGGASGRSNLKGLPGPLLPVAPGDAVELGSVSALEQMGAEPLSTTLPLSVTESRAVSGRVLAQEGDIPLAVLGSYGNGRVLFLAFDPVAQPLAGWGGMPQVWEELLFQSLPSSAVLSGSQLSRRTPSGTPARWLYNLFSAVSNLPALEFPSINLLVALIGGYVLLVGPVNYLVLRRLRRPGLTWATIPALVLLFSSGAYFLAVQAKGSDVQASAATIVEGTPGTEWARVRRMVGILAPSEANYRVELPSKGLVGSWDTGQGGYLSPGGGGPNKVGTEVRHREDGSDVELLKMGLWTMRGLWTDTMRRVEGGLSQNLYVEGDRLKGTVSNEGPVPLKGVWLAGGGGVEDLGALGPDATATVDVKLVDASPDLASPYSYQQMFYTGSPPSGGSRDWRLWRQRRQVLMAAMDSRDADLPSGVSALLVGWTDEGLPEVTVNGTRPTGPSLTVFIEPVTPALRGAFSLPGGLLLGRIVDVDATVQESAPGLVALAGGSATFQFELPTNMDSLDRVAVQIPFPGGSSAAQGIQVLAYHWEDDAWEPLDLKTIKLQSQAGPSTGPVYIPPPPSGAGVAAPTPTPVPVPPPPPVRKVGPGGVVVYSSVPYGLVFNEAMEGELSGQDGLSGHVSPAGLVRIRLVQEGAGAVQLGTPSLAIQGVAGE